MRPIMHLPILYQDQDLVVVAKPPGLLVHRTWLDPHERQFALQLLRDQIGASVYPVHRLDRPTSGALVFALSKDMARAMTNEFTARRVKKSYLAVVRGIPSSAQIRIDYPLKEELDAISDKQAGRNKAPQEAVTEVELLDQIELAYAVDRYPTARYALLRAVPLTGRKHQIRRHLRHLGHPIIGDVTHGVGKHNRFFSGQLGVRRLLLACCEIAFTHPLSGQPLRIQAPLEGEFLSLLQQFGWGRHLES